MKLNTTRYLHRPLPVEDVNSFGEIPIDFDRPIGTTDQIIHSLNIPVDRFFD